MSNYKFNFEPAVFGSTCRIRLPNGTRVSILREDGRDLFEVAKLIPAGPLDTFAIHESGSQWIVDIGSINYVATLDDVADVLDEWSKE